MTIDSQKYDSAHLFAVGFFPLSLTCSWSTLASSVRKSSPKGNDSEASDKNGGQKSALSHLCLLCSCSVIQMRMIC